MTDGILSRGRELENNLRGLARHISADVVAELIVEIERLAPLQFRQAPCYKFCEANAFTIELRNANRREMELLTEVMQLRTQQK